MNASPFKSRVDKWKIVSDDALNLTEPRHHESTDNCVFQLAVSDVSGREVDKISESLEAIRLYFDKSTVGCDAWQETYRKLSSYIQLHEVGHWRIEHIVDSEIPQESKKQIEPELEQIFQGLAQNWREATGSYSLNMRRYAHPTYQSLMHTLGKENVDDVVPLILRELQQRPDMWFEALKVLTKTNPAQNSKTFDEAVTAWITWGKLKQYI
jgi:hypothetical protein